MIIWLPSLIYFVGWGIGIYHSHRRFIKMRAAATREAQTFYRSGIQDGADITLHALKRLGLVNQNVTVSVNTELLTVDPTVVTPEDENFLRGMKIKP